MVIVVAVPGLRWADVTAQGTPNLWDFSRRAALGALSVKAAEDHTTCAAGMLTLGAGNRAVATSEAERVCTTVDSGLAELPGWPAVVRANADEDFGTEPGSLAGAVADSRTFGAGVAAVGAEASRLATARPDGWVPVPPNRASVRVVADVGVYDVTAAERASALAGVDRRLGEWLAPSGPALLTLVVGASDAADGTRSLHVAMAAGSGFEPGEKLASDSTGRAPYVQLIDVAPTVLTAQSIPVPDAMDGRAWESAGGETSVAELAELDAAAVQRLDWGGWWVFMLTCAAASVLVLGCLVLTVAAVRRRRSARVGAQWLCYFVASLPVSSWVAHLLVGWRFPVPVLFVTVGIIAALVATAAYTVARRHPPWGGLVTVVTVCWLVLGLDVVLGTHLQSESLLGDSSIVAGRFAGFGNTATSVFAAAVLTFAGWHLQRRSERSRSWQLVTVGGMAGVVLWLVGAPYLGNDFGGFVMLAAGTAVLFLLVAGLRLRTALSLAGGVGLVAGGLLLGVGLLLERGHVGRFADDVVDGDGWTTVQRKLEASLSSWQTSWHVAVVVVSLSALMLLLRRGGPLAELLRDRSLLRAGLLATAAGALVGALVNDSGVVVLGAAALVVVPLLVGACLRAVDTSPVTAR